MNRSLSPYTPRVRALNYDALKNRRGCQDISGTNYFASMAFIRLCLGRPDDFTTAEKAIYQKLRTVSYTDGPLDVYTEQDEKFSTRWAAWVASSGIRVGQFSEIDPPADSSGFPSSLFPDETPDHLTLGFNRNGWMAIAIQEDLSTILLKRFSDSDGTITSKEFSGTSPILFNNWLTYYDLDGLGYDLVCYYLKISSPNTLYARFERDDFNVEYTIHNGLPADISYLVSSEVFEDFEQQILAIAPNGDFISLTSDQYYLHKSEVSDLVVAMVDGSYQLTAYEQDLTALAEASTLTVAMTGGTTAFLYAQDLTSLRTVGTLTVAMTGGEYNLH